MLVVLDSVRELDLEQPGIDAWILLGDTLAGQLLGSLHLLLVPYLDAVEERAVALRPAATSVVEMIIPTRLGADVTLYVFTATFRTRHFVAAVLLDKRRLAWKAVVRIQPRGRGGEGEREKYSGPDSRYDRPTYICYTS